MTNENAIMRLMLVRHRNDNTDMLNEALDMAIEALRDDDCQKGILTPEERSEVLNAIDDALNGYQVDGYEDTDGMFFKVLISKVERGDSDETVMV